MHRNHIARTLADRASRDVLPNRVLGDRHHRQRLVSAQPERLVVSRRVVADLVEVAEHERHRGEALQTRTSEAQVLVVRLEITLDVEQRKAIPKFVHSIRTLGYVRRLTVFDQQNSAVVIAAWTARQSLWLFG